MFTCPSAEMEFAHGAFKVELRLVHKVENKNFSGLSTLPFIKSQGLRAAVWGSVATLDSRSYTYIVSHGLPGFWHT